MKTKVIGLMLIAAAAIVGGCNQEGSVSKDEADALKNPSKTMPPEAVEAMKNMGKGPSAADKIKPSDKGNY
jgi:hypothetical protein